MPDDELKDDVIEDEALEDEDLLDPKKKKVDGDVSLDELADEELGEDEIEPMDDVDSF